MNRNAGDNMFILFPWKKGHSFKLRRKTRGPGNAFLNSRIKSSLFLRPLSEKPKISWIFTLSRIRCNLNKYVHQRRNKNAEKCVRNTDFWWKDQRCALFQASVNINSVCIFLYVIRLFAIDPIKSLCAISSFEESLFCCFFSFHCSSSKRFGWFLFFYHFLSNRFNSKTIGYTYLWVTSIFFNPYISLLLVWWGYLIDHHN